MKWLASAISGMPLPLSLSLSPSYAGHICADDLRATEDVELWLLSRPPNPVRRRRQKLLLRLA